MFSALLFSWLQGAEFYYNLHEKAVSSLPVGNGRTWIDLGCGPGLVSRLAASKNYDVLGIDRDPFMILSARLMAKINGSKAKFMIGGLDSIIDIRADVLSGASLLAVIPDKNKALQQMWDCVKPSGYLLIIEPTHLMTRENVDDAIKSGLPKKRIIGLRMWASARENRAVDTEIFKSIPAEEESTLDLLDGLVKAWIFKKGTSA
jgi:SAM-dependent methyltransferase